MISGAPSCSTTAAPRSRQYVRDRPEVLSRSATAASATHKAWPSLRGFARKNTTSGDWADKPNYFDVTVWGSLGEIVAKYTSKGRPSPSTAAGNGANGTPTTAQAPSDRA
jgi:hypothetical protein